MVSLVKEEMITQKEIHQLAVKQGWYDKPRSIPDLLCLIHSEVSEALEAYRKGIPIEAKHGMAEELADVVIRVFDIAEYYGIDIMEAVRKKHEFNKTRPYRHGNKNC